MKVTRWLAESGEKIAPEVVRGKIQN